MKINKKLKDKFHLEKVILNPIDRSQGRYEAIQEYVKKNAKTEHWESERTRKISKALSLSLPTKNSTKTYRAFLDLQEGKDEQEKEEKAREIKKLKEDLDSEKKRLEKTQQNLTSEKQQQKGSLERIKLLTEQIQQLELATKKNSATETDLNNTVDTLIKGMAELNKELDKD